MYGFSRVPTELVFNNELFKHDTVDVIRQSAQNEIDLLYREIIDSFHTRNSTRLKALAKQFESIYIVLDDLLQTSEQFLFGKWLDDAKSLATTPVEQQMFEFNARNQISLWGPTGQIVDYANKQWAGVIRDYCLPRWKIFFDELTKALQKKNVKYNEKKCRDRIFREVEEPFGVANKEYITAPTGDTFELARKFAEKISGMDWISE